MHSIRRGNLFQVITKLFMCLVIALCFGRLIQKNLMEDSPEEHDGIVEAAREMNDGPDEGIGDRMGNKDGFNQIRKQTLNKLPNRNESGIEKSKTFRKFAIVPNELTTIANKYCMAERDLTTDRTQLQKVFNSNHYKISFCSATFVATTVTSFVVTVLEFGVRSVPESVNRRPLINWRLLSDLDTDGVDSTMNIMLARNPYDRLFSMYFRMSYSSVSSGFNKNIKKQLGLNKNECAEVSFQNFLEYVVANRNSTIWLPIHATCNPCRAKPTFIIKQETFIDDMKYILREIRATKEEYETITTILINYRIRSMSFLVNELVGNKFHDCFTWMDAAERMWQALKMLGYLPETASFPKNEITRENKINDNLFLTEQVTKVMEQNLNKVDELETQRHKALVAAYSMINAKTLKLVHGMYKHDFRLFNYEESVPK